MMKYVKAASDSDSAILHDVHNSFLTPSNAFFFTEVLFFTWCFLSSRPKTSLVDLILTFESLKALSDFSLDLLWWWTMTFLPVGSNEISDLITEAVLTVFHAFDHPPRIVKSSLYVSIFAVLSRNVDNISFQ